MKERIEQKMHNKDDIGKKDVFAPMVKHYTNGKAYLPVTQLTRNAEGDAFCGAPIDRLSLYEKTLKKEPVEAAEKIEEMEREIIRLKGLLEKVLRSDPGKLNVDDFINDKRNIESQDDSSFIERLRKLGLDLDERSFIGKEKKGTEKEDYVNRAFPKFVKRILENHRTDTPSMIENPVEMYAVILVDNENSDETVEIFFDETIAIMKGAYYAFNSSYLGCKMWHAIVVMDGRKPFSMNGVLQYDDFYLTCFFEVVRA